ncbi:vacuolar fusion protein MON1 homolog A [Pseudomyrmex gracilis]|uniref:vacuolar fusion protein MON1 homolog A n=1 Tax=Pseudomyrmex gracilis TaxID=219809 RepID=UPI0009957E27|nr:vacuolar fusion protein MON1 homolog A [Pseudomyrmex gracilis]XP_020293275.1 vacuolar fusion protein MON1 homolog A [Pseudomyrmex gracilis]XP_020293276.1 vacuolar fusion protein MON1 homolog A [Pseudomyrmex gracilis]
MAAKEQIVVESIDDGIAEPGIEPGASSETMLVTTDSFDDYEQEMSSSIDSDRQITKSTTNTISKIQDDDEHNIATLTATSPKESKKPLSLSDAEMDSVTHCLGQSNIDGDPLHCKKWLAQKKHVFILSQAGKPIYSRYSSEDKLVTVMGVMQALVSFVQAGSDMIRSVHAGDTNFVFVVKGPLILVAVSKTLESVSQLTLQLTYVYNQIVSVLTQSQLNRVYDQRRNFDLRRLLSGSERLIDHLLNFMDREPAFFLGAIKCLPLLSSMRSSITQTIIQTCAKIKNLVFAILLANNQLVTLVRMNKFFLHPMDLHIIQNLVDSSESLKTAESWTPICLPKFDSNGYMHGHVSYLAEDCQACLLLLTVDRDVFFVLSEAKQKIVERLRRTNCLEAINESMNKPTVTTADIGLPEMRHVLYKCKSTAQFWNPGLQPPYTTEEEIERLLGLYQCLHHRLHSPSRPLKLIFQQLDKETMLAWVASGFELYVTFEPLITKPDAIEAVSKLLKWIKKEEERLFILNSPTF